MNRRNFLGMLAASVGGMTLDPERLLWRPGAKLISIPKPSIKPVGETIWFVNTKKFKFDGGVYIQDPFVYNQIGNNCHFLFPFSSKLLSGNFSYGGIITNAS